MKAGRLRHRVDIEEPVTAQDEHGDPVVTWVPIWTDVPAAIEPVSGKEFVAGQGIAGQVTARIIVRWRRGAERIGSGMRVVHRVAHGSPTEYDVDYYNIAAALPDPDSGRVHFTLMCSRGVNDG